MVSKTIVVRERFAALGLLLRGRMFTKLVKINVCVNYKMGDTVLRMGVGVAISADMTVSVQCGIAASYLCIKQWLDLI